MYVLCTVYLYIQLCICCLYNLYLILVAMQVFFIYLFVPFCWPIYKITLMCVGLCSVHTKKSEEKKNAIQNNELFFFVQIFS